MEIYSVYSIFKCILLFTHQDYFEIPVVIFIAEKCCMEISSLVYLTHVLSHHNGKKDPLQYSSQREC